jgi:hypothetical protein
MTPQEFEKAVRDVVQTELAKNTGRPPLSDATKAELKALFDAAIDNKLAPLKADVLELSRIQGTFKDWLASGKGTTGSGLYTMTAEDYKRLAPARINAASLQEIVDLTG